MQAVKKGMVIYMYFIDKKLSARINILKFLSIIMVVFIHSSPEVTAYNNLAGGSLAKQSLDFVIYIISQSISRTAVPLFFLISSILLFSKEFKWLPNMKKKCRSVLLPYLFWNSFWILFSYAAQTIKEIAVYFPRDSYYVRDYGILEWLKAYTYLNGNYPYLYTLWFLRDLFVLNLLAIVIKKIVDKAPVLLLILMAVLWFSNISIPFLDNQTIVFFTLGYYIVKYQVDVKWIDRINSTIAIVFFAGFTAMDFAFSYTFPAVHNLSVVIGILFFIKLSGQVLDYKICDRIVWLSKYSFIIYVFHEMNLSMLKKLSLLVFPQTILVQLLEYMMIPVIIIIGCIIFGMILQKISPKFYSLVTGNRT